MKIGITGANSFIGKEVIRQGLAKGWECVGYVRNMAKCAGMVSERLTLKERIPKEYVRLTDGEKNLDCLMTLAWNGTRGDKRMAAEEQKQSFRMTMDAIRNALNNGCRLIVTAGSQAEYGKYDRKIKEDDPLRPNTEYGKYKAEVYYRAKELTREYKAKLIEPRYFSLYGCKDASVTMISSVLDDMIAGRPCKLTACVQMWDFLYLEDGIRALISLIENKKAEGAYNFGSGDCRPLKEFVFEMKKIVNSKSELCFGAVPYPATGMTSIQPDISKLKEAAQWKAEISFAEGIKRIYKEKTNGRFQTDK